MLFFSFNRRPDRDDKDDWVILTYAYELNLFDHFGCHEVVLESRIKLCNQNDQCICHFCINSRQVL